MENLVCSYSTQSEAKAYIWEEYAKGREVEEDTEAPKFVAGDMFLVRFGKRSGDPVWAVDVFSNKTTCPRNLWYLLNDAINDSLYHFTHYAYKSP